jgi:actin-related protein 6
MEALQNNTDQMVFEYFRFNAYYRSLAPALNAYNDIETYHNNKDQIRDAGILTNPSLNPPPTPPLLPPECLLVVDIGYSHTTVTPLYLGKPLQSAIRRLTIGGKFLTNYLKEQCSIRHFYVMDETYLINEAKEAACYVCPTGSSFVQNLEAVWKGGLRDDKKIDYSLVADYVLPDYETLKKGYLRPHDPTRNKRLAGPKEALLPLGNERFKTPELLFHPSDVGLPEVGIPELIMQSVNTLPEGLRAGMLSNVLVVGGSSLFKGLMERLENDLRALVPAEWPLRVVRAPDPVKSAWLGGARLAADVERLKDLAVTRNEFEERGTHHLQEKFSGR